MTKQEVIKKIGKENWDAFLDWMRGQTVAFINGEVHYYDCDVEAFIRKMKTGYDRQDTVMWD